MGILSARLPLSLHRNARPCLLRNYQKTIDETCECIDERSSKYARRVFECIAVALHTAREERH